jgi:hypothetical protein
MDSLFSDAYRKETQQLRQLVDSFEAISEPNVTSPTPPITYQNLPESSQNCVPLSRSTMKAFNGSLFALVIMGMLITTFFHLAPDLWFWSTLVGEEYAIPQ